MNALAYKAVLSYMDFGSKNITRKGLSSLALVFCITPTALCTIWSVVRDSPLEGEEIQS